MWSAISSALWKGVAASVVRPVDGGGFPIFQDDREDLASAG